MFFFNDTATTEIYTLSLHDALPIFRSARGGPSVAASPTAIPRRSGASCRCCWTRRYWRGGQRSEENTSELQSRQYLVCRLLLEKKRKTPEYYSDLYDTILRAHLGTP